MDIGANFKITAGVVGQSAVDKLNTGVDKLNTGVERLPGLAKQAGLALVGLGAGVGLATLKTKFDDTVKSMLGLLDAAERTGSTVEKMGSLAAVARITGEDMGAIEAGIIKMNKALAGADDESKGAAKALDAIGLSIKQLRQLDPADAFSLIATKLDDFADSGSKTALVMDIFGKSGAQLIPALKDVAELGGQVSRVTAQQAQMADQYDRALRRLEASKQDLYRTISTQLLPVATDFVSSLLDVTNGTNGVKDAARSLAADGSMQSVFQEGARAAAALLDILSVLGRTLVQFKDSLGAVYQDLRVVGSWPGLFASDERKAEFAKVVAERDAYVQAANKRLQDRIDQGLTPFSDALEKRFAARAAGVTEPEKPRGSLAGYQSRTPTGPAPVRSPYEVEMNTLGRDAVKLQTQIDQVQRLGRALDETRGAQVRLDIEQGKFGALSEAAKTKLIMQADAVDTLAARLREAKTVAEITRQTEAIEQETLAMGENIRTKQMLAFYQELETKGIKEGSEAWLKLVAARKAALDNRENTRANPLTGFQEGIASIGDQVKDAATNWRNWMVGAFDKAADALTDFVMTGKANFRDFARSVLADLAKMIVKQMLFNALKAGMSFFGFGGSGVAAAAKGATFDGGVAKFALGGVVNQPTPFRFANGGTIQNGLMGEAGPEAIIPLKRGRDGRLGVSMSGGGGTEVTIGSINVNSDGAAANDASGRNAAALGKALSAAVQQEIIKQKRPGGLLAA